MRTMKIKNVSISVFSAEKDLNRKFLTMKFLKGNKMVSVKSFLLVKLHTGSGTVLKI